MHRVKGENMGESRLKKIRTIGLARSTKNNCT